MLCPQLSTGDHDTYCVLLVYKAKAVGAYLLQKPSGEVTGPCHRRQSQRRRRVGGRGDRGNFSRCVPGGLNKSLPPSGKVAGAKARPDEGRVRLATYLGGQYWQCRPSSVRFADSFSRGRSLLLIFKHPLIPSAVRTPHRKQQHGGVAGQVDDLALHVAVGQHRDQARHGLPRAAPGVPYRAAIISAQTRTTMTGPVRWSRYTKILSSAGHSCKNWPAILCRTSGRPPMPAKCGRSADCRAFQYRRGRYRSPTARFYDEQRQNIADCRQQRQFQRRTAASRQPPGLGRGLRVTAWQAPAAKPINTYTALTNELALGRCHQNYAHGGQTA